MKIGTKSVLFGAHCFLIHPWFVALAWWRLYGFPRDPRLWVAFFIHDLGYWGKPNMDGPEGEEHVVWAANKMHFWFDDASTRFGRWCNRVFGTVCLDHYYWHDLCMFHSRFYASKMGAKPSCLCYADKLSFCLTPRWLYCPMAWATGELAEYMAKTEENGKYSEIEGRRGVLHWHKSATAFLESWVAENRSHPSRVPPTVRRLRVVYNEPVQCPEVSEIPFDWQGRPPGDRRDGCHGHNGHEPPARHT